MYFLIYSFFNILSFQRAFHIWNDACSYLLWFTSMIMSCLSACFSLCLFFSVILLGFYLWCLSSCLYHLSPFQIFLGLLLFAALFVPCSLLSFIWICEAHGVATVYQMCCTNKLPCLALPGLPYIEEDYELLLLWETTFPQDQPLLHLHSAHMQRQLRVAWIEQVFPH